MPEMGTSLAVHRAPAPASLASALFGSTQQRVLGLLFGQPDRSFYATELIALARDVMIISDSLDYADTILALQPVSEGLGREINPILYSARELAKRVNDDSGFVGRVLSQPRIWLFGGEDALRV